MPILRARRRANNTLGQKWVDYAKAHLVQNGIPEDRIRNDFEGLRDSIACIIEGRRKSQKQKNLIEVSR